MEGAGLSIVMQISRAAHAKVNLMLSVGNALPAEHAKAGYHPILSWFHAIALHDTLTLARAAGASRYDIVWAEDAPRMSLIDWPLEKDLAVRAHKALEAKVGKALPVTMRLEKRIPVGGGLGGGSSDAAAALLATRELYELDVSDEALREIAMTLGSDVAFFVDTGVAEDVEEGGEEGEGDAERGHAPGAAIVGGLGEEIERIAALDDALIVIVPEFGCATGEVYKAFDELRAKETRAYEIERALAGNKGRERLTGPRETMVKGRVERAMKAGRLDTDDLFNDLDKPAFMAEPRLGKLNTTLSSICRTPAHVTGSGSCLFVVPEPKKVEWTFGRVTKAIEAVQADVGPCVAILTRLI